MKEQPAYCIGCCHSVDQKPLYVSVLEKDKYRFSENIENALIFLNKENAENAFNRLWPNIRNTTDDYNFFITTLNQKEYKFKDFDSYLNHLKGKEYDNRAPKN